jgi:hypothetical protein
MKLELNNILKELLMEEKTAPFIQQVRDWFKTKGLDAKITSNTIDVKKNGQTVFSKETDYFFRSAHLLSFINQVCKKLNIKNDFNVPGNLTSSKPPARHPNLTQLHLSVKEIKRNLAILIKEIKDANDPEQLTMLQDLTNLINKFNTNINSKY